MRYAILSDIHGNLYALKRVLEDIQKQRIDQLIFLGDYYFDFPWPNEVIKLVRDSQSAYIVSGNKEDYLSGLEGQDQSTWTHDQFAPLYWNFREITKDNLKYLVSLPKVITISEMISPLFLAHSPEEFFGASVIDTIDGISYAKIIKKQPEYTHWDYQEYINRTLFAETDFQKTLSLLADGIYMFGHYHTQWHAEVEGKLLINPGSCGFSMNNDNRACYSILDLNSKEWKVEERRVSYDVESVIKCLLDSKLNEAAPIWCKLNVLHLRTGRQYLNSLFRYIDEYIGNADKSRPYPNHIWNQAAERWFETHRAYLDEFL